MKPFDLEAFRKGQKALTRSGQIATFLAVCDKCDRPYRLVFEVAGTLWQGSLEGKVSPLQAYSHDLVSMTSRHQHLIDSYDPEDTWQYRYGNTDSWRTVIANPVPFDEDAEYRLHPHNDLIKARKKGAKIETMEVDGTWHEVDNPNFYEDWEYRVKPTTKTVYEWMYKLHGANHFEFIAFADGDNIQYGEYPVVMIKTGRSWEVEV